MALDRALRVLPLAAFVLVAALLSAGSGRAQSSGDATALPVLGTGDRDMVLMGADADGAWAYRRLPTDVPPPVVNGKPLSFGSGSGPQLAFLRATGSQWTVAETPLDADGNPYRGPDPDPLSARMTPHGGGVLAGDGTVLARDPGGPFRALADAPDGIRTAVDAAYDDGDTTGVLFATRDAVQAHDDAGWTEERIEGPPTGLQIVALAATAADNAWMLARTGDGLVLLDREQADDGAHVWRERTTLDGAEPLGGKSQPLTATADGVWIDGTRGGHQFTAYYKPGTSPPPTGTDTTTTATDTTPTSTDTGTTTTPTDTGTTTTWCDADGCDHPLGFTFDVSDGYRSFAWTGDGFGTRVVTDAGDGTYVRFAGTAFARRLGGGGPGLPGGAFRTADDGWLDGPVRVATGIAAPQRMASFPVAVRTPLAAVAGQPGGNAIAVGNAGAVLRYGASTGWVRERLHDGAGNVATPDLRGVAWPEADRAHAVGDGGEMWRWSSAGGWQPDPGKPSGLSANLRGIAFAPGDASRGYAVGSGGTILRYAGGSWTADSAPTTADLTSIAFAGSQALVAAGGDLLVNDGGGWQVDAGLHTLLAQLQDPKLVAVAGLPDGGGVVAGRDFVAERDRAGADWRFADQPLPGSTVVAAAAFHEDGKVRALVSVQPQLDYPDGHLAGDGYLLRETADGWRDEQQTAWLPTTDDQPVKSDPILALLVDDAGNGWLVGGWSGDLDADGRGSTDGATKDRIRTGAVFAYAATGSPPTSPVNGAATITTDPGYIRFLAAGNGKCEQACADLANQSIGPDANVTAALGLAAGLSGQSDGPRALLYTGARDNAVTDGSGGSAPQPATEEERYADLLGSQPALRVLNTVADGDSSDGTVDAYMDAFAAFGAPFGSSDGARTHYAWDSSGASGTVRIIVIDNSRGSLADSDPYQNPREAQLPWLVAQLQDAKARGVPAIVVGSRDISGTLPPPPRPVGGGGGGPGPGPSGQQSSSANGATDADTESNALDQNGASLYVYDDPEQTSYTVIGGFRGTAVGGGPNGPSVTQVRPLFTFGTGTLGYRSPTTDPTTSQTDAQLGGPSMLMLELDPSTYDPATNRATVYLRNLPLLSSLALDPVDGTSVAQSHTALFSGLGRAPLGGDRPAGGDPYLDFPPEACVSVRCRTSRVDPEYTFTSSDPNVANFVTADANAAGGHTPAKDSNGNLIEDHRSGLLCAFSAGTTTITLSAGGLNVRQQITVQPGATEAPCLTPPAAAAPATPTTPTTPTPAAPATPKAKAPKTPKPAPKAPAPAQPAPVPPAPVRHPPAQPPPPPLAPAPLGAVPLPTAPTSATPAVGKPPAPTIGRPIPPGTAPARVFQVERKRSLALAPDLSQAFVRYDDTAPSAALELGAIVLLALGGATAFRALRARARARPAPARIRDS